MILLFFIACSSLNEMGIYTTNDASLVCGEVITINDGDGISNREIRQRLDEILKYRKECPGTTAVEAENDFYNKFYGNNPDFR